MAKIFTIDWQFCNFVHFYRTPKKRSDILGSLKSSLGMKVNFSFLESGIIIE